MKGYLIGSPVSQSLSHLTHNALLKKLCIPAFYHKREVAVEGIAEAIERLKQEKVRWLGVTMPLKQAIVPYLDRLEGDAETLQTVNTVIVEDGIWIGKNCDGIAALNAIESEVAIRQKKMLVIGAGGTARAIAHEGKKRGANLFIWNRTKAHGEALCHDLGLSYADSLKGDWDIVINATSVGMKSDAMPVPIEVLEPVELVMDVVYTPVETRLLREAAMIGCKTVSGLKMFLELSAIQLSWAFDLGISKDRAIEIMEMNLSQ